VHALCECVIVRWIDIKNTIQASKRHYLSGSQDGWPCGDDDDVDSIKNTNTFFKVNCFRNVSLMG
jgi:hypothetical protein